MTTILLSVATLLSALFSVSTNLPALAAEIPTQATTPTLTADEIADLQYMREEEKLAHDVYTNLYAQWGSPIFNNIAAGEQAHMEAVLSILDRYGIDDPAAGNPAGVFTNPELQALYDQLVAQGSVSLADAFYVGATIEEVDIVDLQESLATSTNSDITTLYQNLLSGSESHLRAFVRQWEATTGQTYVPQLLSQADYEAIMAGSAGHGNGAGGHGSNGSTGNTGGRWGNSMIGGGPVRGQFQP
ncbi:MAG: DUF2202 domain-containing protein [Chloroflexota bacterium]